MRYKILKRIQDGQSTVGYQLLSEDGKILNIPKDQVIQVACQGLVINATYNKHTKSLSGIKGTDLRSLPVIKQTELNKNTRSNKHNDGGKAKNDKHTHCSSSDAAAAFVLKLINNASKAEDKEGTNHKLAKEYINKQKILGLPELRLEFLDNDRVELIQVLDTESTGTFVMPSFITDHTVFKDIHGYPCSGPFVYCKFREIVIRHNYTNWNYLFSGLESDNITIKYYGNPVKYLESTFYDCKKVKTINLSTLDASQAISTARMFCRCKSLSSLDISNFNTSNVIDMHRMFYECESLLSIDTSKFDTSNVTDMSETFYGCKSLSSLDISNFNTSNVTDMHGMFCLCESLLSIDTSKLDTSHVKNMNGMFNSCKSLTQLDLSNFDVSNVYDLRSMFHCCKSLVNLDISNFDTSNVGHTSDMSYMFSGCEALKSLDIGNLKKMIKAGSMSDMFYGCKSLESIDISRIDTSRVTDMGGMFEGCEALKSIDFSKVDVSIVNNMTRMFYGCKSLKRLDISNFKTDYSGDRILTVRIEDIFSDCPGLDLIICREGRLARLKNEYLKGNVHGKAEFHVQSNKLVYNR